MGKKVKRPTRPPRVKVDKKGRRYIRFKKKKIYVSKKIADAELVKWLIKRFHKKRKHVGPKKVAKEMALLKEPKNAVYANLLEDVGNVNYFKQLKAQALGVKPGDVEKEVNRLLQSKAPKTKLLAPPNLPPPQQKAISDEEYEELQHLRSVRNLMGEEKAEEYSRRVIEEDARKHAEEKLDKTLKSANKHKVSKTKLIDKQVIIALDKGDKKLGIKALKMSQVKDIAKLNGIATRKQSNGKVVSREKAEIIRDLVADGQQVILDAYEEARKKIQ